MKSIRVVVPCRASFISDIEIPETITDKKTALKWILDNDILYDTVAYDLEIEEVLPEDFREDDIDL